jgi:hypothetical protein
MTNIIDTIEDYLCDKCDELFAADGLVCDKVFNPEQQANRAAFVNQVLTPLSDQSGVGVYKAQILENRLKRSECTQDVEILRTKLTKYGDKLPNGLAIYISLEYIMMPIKITVGTTNVFTVSANFNIKVR